MLKAAIRETAARLRADGHVDLAVQRENLDEWLAREASQSLHKLADRLDRMLSDLGVDALSPDTLSILMSLHQLDPGGDTFRYAKVSKGGRWVDAPRLSSLPRTSRCTSTLS